MCAYMYMYISMYMYMYIHMYMYMYMSMSMSMYMYIYYLKTSYACSSCARSGPSSPAFAPSRRHLGGCNPKAANPNIGALIIRTGFLARVPFKRAYKGYYKGYYKDLVLGP